MSEFANECPGCGNLSTFNHKTYWAYYCHNCEWGFGLRREINRESPMERAQERAALTEKSR